MNVNSAAVLTLISNLMEQLIAAQQEAAALRAELESEREAAK